MFFLVVGAIGSKRDEIVDLCGWVMGVFGVLLVLMIMKNVIIGYWNTNMMPQGGPMAADPTKQVKREEGEEEDGLVIASEMPLDDDEEEDDEDDVMMTRRLMRRSWTVAGKANSLVCGGVNGIVIFCVQYVQVMMGRWERYIRVGYIIYRYIEQ